MKKLSEMTERELIIHEVFAHLDGIDKDVQRMTSGNYMHNTGSIRLSVKIIKDRLISLGIKEDEQ